MVEQCTFIVFGSSQNLSADFFVSYVYLHKVFLNQTWELNGYFVVHRIIKEMKTGMKTRL